METELRKSSRVSSKMKMQVYTSLSVAAYTVQIENISSQGALVKAKHLPKVGETISFNVCDAAYNFLFSGSGKVVRLVEDESGYQGFAIEFAQPMQKKVLSSITH